jgi:hypothetical protein
MAINFPSNPALNAELTVGANTWKFNGVAWDIVPSTILNLTSLTSTDINVTNLTVTGTVTGIEQSYALDDLTDVDLTIPPTDGQVLSYNAGALSWQASTVVGGGGSFNGGTVTNPIVVNNTTNATDATSGAFRTTGGIAVTKDIFVNGNINFNNSAGDQLLNLKSRGEIRFDDSDNSAYVGFRAPNIVTQSRTYTLPPQDGTAGQLLRTNGSGALSWVSVITPEGGLAAGGSNTQVQFNDASTFSGDPGFTFVQSSLLLTVPKLTATQVVTVTDTTASTSTTTGAVQITGGTGIQGQLNVGGATSKFTGATAATSTITGTIVVTGGMGISGAVHVGSNVVASTAPTQQAHLTNKQYVDANVLAFSVAFGA